jgi:hypothetical protein
MSHYLLVAEPTKGGPRGGNPHQWPLHKKNLACIKDICNKSKTTFRTFFDEWFTWLNKILGYSVPADLRQIFHHHRAGHAGELHREDILS